MSLPLREPLTACIEQGTSPSRSGEDPAPILKRSLMLLALLVVVTFSHCFFILTCLTAFPHDV